MIRIEEVQLLCPATHGADYLAYTFLPRPKSFVPIGGNDPLKSVTELVADTLRNFGDGRGVSLRIFDDFDPTLWVE